MPSPAESIRLHLGRGPLNARRLAEILACSQPTVSRAIAALGDEIVRFGTSRSIHYALRDTRRGLPTIAVHRVDAEGRIATLGTLIPVCPEGFVMVAGAGPVTHHDGLPWWLFDMRPQGYLGRAYAGRHGAALGLPPRLTDWNDTHALRALLAHGHDVVGNLLLGDTARDHFLATPLPVPIPARRKAETYAGLARDAAQGVAPGSSAGGEQPKFATCAETPAGPRHVLVKFSEAEDSPVSERWRDLLLAEHLALETLREAGLPAAASRIVDHGRQRFLEVERFDRAGPLGRRGLISLAAMDAEFVGAGRGGWPPIVASLARAGHVRPAAEKAVALLWAFGTLIGNTDMHGGNLSFVTETGRPYELAPAYDMSPMAFAPRSGGGLPETLPEARLDAVVPNAQWRQGETLARRYLARAEATSGFSRRFAPCLRALERHIDTAAQAIERMG